MNLQQLEYLIMIDESKHFRWAAKKYKITQPCLTMTVQRLEEELQLKIFIRNHKRPLELTEEGKRVIDMARDILADVQRIKQYASKLAVTVNGQLRIGIIPTLAPYIQQILIKELTEQYANLTLTVTGATTDQIVTRMKKGEMDMAVISSPLLVPKFMKYKLFDEQLYAYVSEEVKTSRDKLYPYQVGQYKLWLPQDDEHFCKRVVKLCKLPQTIELQYTDGNLETLVNMVDHYNQGLTLIPRLAIEGLSPEQKKNVKGFAPVPLAREICLTTLNTYQYLGIVEAVKKALTGYFNSIRKF